MEELKLTEKDIVTEDLGCDLEDYLDYDTIYLIRIEKGKKSPIFRTPATKVYLKKL